MLRKQSQSPRSAEWRIGIEVEFHEREDSLSAMSLAISDLEDFGHHAEVGPISVEVFKCGAGNKADAEKQMERSVVEAELKAKVLVADIGQTMGARDDGASSLP